jgi:hypothetical protein
MGDTRPITVQINADTKPSWLWSYVSRCGTLTTTSHETYDVPMYWDPLYLRLQQDLLGSLATYLHTSPYAGRVALVRSSPNAVGTEHLLSGPPSTPCTGGTSGFTTPWASSDNGAYQTGVMQAYVDALLPDTHLALRADTLSGNPDTDGWFSRGAWMFSTGTEADEGPTQDLDVLAIHYVMQLQVTQAYWEPYRNSTGLSSNGRTDYANGVSWNYWRLLLELEKGVSFVAVYAQDLMLGETNSEYHAAFDFVNRYAGYHRSPEIAPGAWVALREGDRTPVGNYGWYLTQSSPDTTSIAVESDDGNSMIGPATQRYGRFARRTDVASGKSTMSFQLDPTFRAGIVGATCLIHVTYLDTGTGQFDVAWGTGASDRQTVTRAGSGTWVTAAPISVPGSAFTGSLPGASDLTLSAVGSTDTTFHMIEIEVVGR